nr:hypothetical protein [Nocardia cyriacigeorgica]
MIDGPRRWIYTQLRERCRRLAGALAPLADGRPVAVLAPSTHVLLEAHFGAPWAGVPAPRPEHPARCPGCGVGRIRPPGPVRVGRAPLARACPAAAGHCQGGLSSPEPVRARTVVTCN